MMNRWKERAKSCAYLYLLMFAWTGCARSTYLYGLPNRPVTKQISSESCELTFGGEYPRLDKAERWIHYPSEKFKHWFTKEEVAVDPTEMRRLAVNKAQEYLVLNGLTDINIDIRQYDPATQWRRLRNNDSIHPFWKYTGGYLSHLSYTLFPGRVFRVDRFDPYTKTLSLNSTDPSMALYAAAEAKIIYNRRYPGTYLAACDIPFVGISKNIHVANDILSYARNRQDWSTEKELTPVIYSNFGGDLVFQALPFVPDSDEFPFYYVPVISFVGSTVGEVTARTVLNQRDKERHSP